MEGHIGIMNKNVSQQLKEDIKQRMYCSVQYNLIPVGIRNEIAEKIGRGPAKRIHPILNALSKNIYPEGSGEGMLGLYYGE